MLQSACSHVDQRLDRQAADDERIFVSGQDIVHVDGASVYSAIPTQGSRAGLETGFVAIDPSQVYSSTLSETEYTPKKYEDRRIANARLAGQAKQESFRFLAEGFQTAFADGSPQLGATSATTGRPENASIELAISSRDSATCPMVVSKRQKIQKQLSDNLVAAGAPSGPCSMEEKEMQLVRQRLSLLGKSVPQ